MNKKKFHWLTVCTLVAMVGVSVPQQITQKNIHPYRPTSAKVITGERQSDWETGNQKHKNTSSTHKKPHKVNATTTTTRQTEPSQPTTTQWSSSSTPQWATTNPKQTQNPNSVPTMAPTNNGSAADLKDKTTNVHLSHRWGTTAIVIGVVIGLIGATVMTVMGLQACRSMMKVGTVNCASSSLPPSKVWLAKSLATNAGGNNGGGTCGYQQPQLPLKHKPTKDSITANRVAVRTVKETAGGGVGVIVVVPKTADGPPSRINSEFGKMNSSILLDMDVGNPSASDMDDDPVVVDGTLPGVIGGGGGGGVGGGVAGAGGHSRAKHRGKQRKAKKDRKGANGALKGQVNKTTTSHRPPAQPHPNSLAGKTVKYHKQVHQ